MKKNKDLFFLKNNFIIGLQLIASAVMLVAVIRLNLLPTKFLMPIIFALFLFFLIMLLWMYKTRPNSTSNKIAKILSLVLSLLMLGGTYSVVKGDGFLRDVTGANRDVHRMSIIVLDEKPYETIEDVKDLPLGANMLMDKSNVTKALENLKDKENIDFKVNEYNRFTSLVENLENGSEEVIILNEAHREIIEEFDENFGDITRVIHTVEIEKEVVLDDKNTDVSKDTFSIFLTGIDTYGPVSSVARSDVNMIVTVNPRQNQVLLTSIPRDYHVPLATPGAYDKLTHAGIYGVEESVKTLENLLSIDIDYYMRVNFSSVEQIIDALGGIDVNSKYGFSAGGYQYTAGMNHMNGPMALRFVRERYQLPNGDNDRIMNQQAVMEGIIRKAISPAIITNYNSILQSVQGSFELSMPEKDLKKLIKNQVDTMEDWDILQYRLKGYGSHSTTTYSMPGWNLYVMEPDYDTVEKASSLILEMEKNNRISLE